MAPKSGYPNFSEQWGSYTFREKLLYLLSLSLCLLFILISLATVIVPEGYGIGEMGLRDSASFTIDYNENNDVYYEDSSFDKTTRVYIVNPFFGLVLTILLVLYAIILFIPSNKNKEVYSEDHKIPSAPYVTETLLHISGGVALLAFAFFLFVGVFGDLQQQGIYSSCYGDNYYCETHMEEEEPHVTDIFQGVIYQAELGASTEWHDEWFYDYSVTYNGKNPYRGTWSGYFIEDLPPIDQLSYLYVPNLIFLLLLGALTRRKNNKENGDFIEEFGYNISPEQEPEPEPEPEPVKVKRPPRNPDEEMKNTCKRCSKVWYLDADELDDLEERLETSTQLMAQSQGIGMLTALFNPMLSAQMGTMAGTSTTAFKMLADELNEKSRCPECKSKSIEREIVGAGATVSKKVVKKGKKVVKKVKAEEGSLVDELKKLNELKEQGILDDKEFKSAKKKLIDKFS